MDQYQRGATARRTWTIEDDGVAADPATYIKVKITDPAGTVVVAELAATKAATGSYYYNYAIAADAELGVYQEELITSDGGIINIKASAFEVIGRILLAGYCCTIEQVKRRLDVTGTNIDALLGDIVRGVAGQCEGFCNRQLLRPAAAVTEYYHGGYPAGSDTIYLNYFPAITITSVKESLLHDHASEDALTANADYVINDDRGILKRIGAWLTGIDAVQVVYLGGYTNAAESPGTGEIAMPDAIQEAAVMQSSFTYQRRRELGLTSMGGAGGSISAYAQDKLLPGVRELLAPYRRVLFG